MARVTSWTDQGMDWANPNLTDWRYVDALASAINERQAALGWTPTAFPDFEGRYLSRAVLSDIKNKVTQTIPWYINHTVENTFKGRENEVRWSVESISEVTGFGEVSFEDANMSTQSYNEHAKKLYQTINLLRCHTYREPGSPVVLRTNCDRHSSYSSLWTYSTNEEPTLDYAHPHGGTVGTWYAGTSGMGSNDGGGLVQVWNDLVMSYWASTEWGDNNIEEFPFISLWGFTLYSAAQSGNGHGALRFWDTNSAWIRSWRQRAKIKFTFPTDGNQNDDVIAQIWQTRKEEGVRRTLSNGQGTTYYENTSAIDTTQTLIGEFVLKNNEESDEIDTEKLIVEMVDVLDRVKMSDATSSTQNIHEITRNFTIKISQGSPQVLDFAFKDW